VALTDDLIRIWR